MNVSLNDWLTEENNPAVAYRTQTELLKENADKAAAKEWITAHLPGNWQQTKGLWYVYYLTAVAECGLTGDDIEIDTEKALSLDSFGFGCEDFMHLRALVMLGYADRPEVADVLGGLISKQLPDGGFLCGHRVKKFNYTPKSCVKSNNLALMLCSECAKRGIRLDIESGLLEYFWRHDIFYKASEPSELMLNVRKGWRSIDTFYPFEVMRVGLQNIVEAFCALGHGGDERLSRTMKLLNSKRDNDGRVILEGTLTKSYLPKERVGRPSKWATFYTLLAEKAKGELL